MATMAEGEELQVVAKYDYTAENGQELSIRKSERLILLDDSKDWWRVKNSENRQGYVPSNYVKIAKPKSLFSSLLKKGAKKSKNDSKQQASTCPSPSLNNGNTRPRNNLDNSAPASTQVLAQFLPAIVKFNYTAQRQDELTLVKGESILVMEKSSDGWWKGQKKDSTCGWFPSNYVEEDVTGGDTADNLLYSTAAGAEVGSGGSQSDVPELVLALYTFAGNKSGELPFEKGEKLEVLQASEEDPDWWQARNSRGEIGLIPRNYVTAAAHDQESDRTTSGSSSTPHSQSISSISNTSLAGVVGRRQFHVSGPLAERDWYYGKITRQQCEEILTRHAENGDFLIRDSESTTGHYTVVLKAPNRNKHFRVRVQDNTFEIGQQKFNSLDELIEHYKKHPIFKQENEKLYLIKPFSFPSPSSSDNF